WAHRGIDLHLVMHESCLRPIERVAGSGSARVTRPPVASAFRQPREAATARRGLGPPDGGHLVLISGAGRAVADLAAAARAPRQLTAALGRSLDLAGQGVTPLPNGPTAASLILERPVRPAPKRSHRPLAAAAAAAAVTALLTGFTFAAAAPYRVIANALEL